MLLVLVMVNVFVLFLVIASVRGIVIVRVLVIALVVCDVSVVL